MRLRNCDSAIKMNHEATEITKKQERSDKNEVVEISKFHVDHLFFSISAFLRDFVAKKQYENVGNALVPVPHLKL